jgi:hypothetical protein
MPDDNAKDDAKAEHEYRKIHYEEARQPKESAKSWAGDRATTTYKKGDVQHNARQFPEEKKVDEKTRRAMDVAPENERSHTYGLKDNIDPADAKNLEGSSTSMNRVTMENMDKNRSRLFNESGAESEKVTRTPIYGNRKGERVLLGVDQVTQRDPDPSAAAKPVDGTNRPRLVAGNFPDEASRAGDKAAAEGRKLSPEERGTVQSELFARAKANQEAQESAEVRSRREVKRMMSSHSVDGGKKPDNEPSKS